MEIAFRVIVIYTILLIVGLIIIGVSYNIIKSAQKDASHIIKSDYKRVMEFETIQDDDLKKIVLSCFNNNKDSSKEKLCYIIKLKNQINISNLNMNEISPIISNCNYIKNIFIYYVPPTVKIECS